MERYDDEILERTGKNMIAYFKTLKAKNPEDIILTEMSDYIINIGQARAFVTWADRLCDEIIALDDRSKIKLAYKSGIYGMEKILSGNFIRQDKVMQFRDSKVIQEFTETYLFSKKYLHDYSIKPDVPIKLRE